MSNFGWAFVKGGLLTSSAPPDKSVQFNNGVQGLGGSGNFTFDNSSKTLNLTGTLNVSGTINANRYNVDVVNKTVTNLNSNGSTKFGDTDGDLHSFTGSLDISASTNPIRLYGLQAGTPPNNSSYLALNSSFQLVLTSAAGAGGGSGGSIGAAEDGSYADGLFSDFTTNTPVGTAIDKINEILKIIVPGPAPAVDRINFTNPGGTGLKLSINNSSKPVGYTEVGNTGSFSDSLGVNSEYLFTTSGEDFRLGVYNGQQEITGVINFHVNEQRKGSEVNYTHNAFGNAESGSLKLFVNGALKHTLNLTASGAGNPNTGSNPQLNNNGSGFFDLSISASAKDQNGSLYDIFQHRTSKYVVDPQDQRKGWNIAKIEHEFGSTTYITNFVQWFNDTDANSNAMSVSSPTISVAGSGAKYLSGVKYFTAANVTYTSNVSNVYKHTYPTGNVLSFTQTNLSPASATSLPAIGGSETFNKTLNISQVSTNSTPRMFGTTFSRGINLIHPLKSDLSNAGVATSNPTLIYNVSNASDNLNEKFDDESFRITSGSYDSQGAVVAGSATWNSQNHMTGAGAAGHTDGLMFFTGSLRSPKNTSEYGGITNGNFSSLGDGPTGNPNYSGQSGVRTFYRKIENPGPDAIRDLRITSTKSTKINNSAFGSDNAQFFIKIPGTTGWMDISQDFVYGAIADGNGAKISAASTGAGASDAGNSVHCVTFGTASIADDDFAVIKILADASWTGKVENLVFKLGASTSTAATAADPLDNIDLDDGAGEDAKLSFGTSNAISGYTNVVGGVGGMSAVNSNGEYKDNGTTNRGVFKALEVMGGTLNEDVVDDGQNHPANTFGNAYTGSLLLIVNDTTASTVSLDNLNAFNNLSSNTGFTLGAVDFSKTSDLIPDYTKPYRNGTYSIGTSQQRSGWNYARVIHRIGDSDTETNYVQWVVDPSGSNDNTAITAGTLSKFFGNSSEYYYQSGVGYFTTNSAPSASFEFLGSNFYSNVYYSGSDGVSFPTKTNCSVNNLRITGSGITTFNSGVDESHMPALNNTPDCELTDIQVTGSLRYTGGTSIMTDLSLFTIRNVSIEGRIKHVPNFKSSKDTNTRTSANFMFYSGSVGSSTLTSNEYFGAEDYRIVSGNYPNQTDLTSASNKWNSSTEIDNGGSHDDGMVTANGYMISPLNIGDDGDTRNTTEGGTLEAPEGNPDYSTLTNDIRTYYRLFRYTGSTTTPNITLTLYGDATLRGMDPTYTNYYQALTTSGGVNKNVNVEIRISTDSGADPDQSTTWLDCGKIIIGSENKQAMVGGVRPGVRSGAASGEDVSIDSNGLALTLDLGTSRLIQNQYYVIKVSAHKNWTGYISRIQVAVG